MFEIFVDLAEEVREGKMRRIKKGAVVSIPGWGGIVGIYQTYDPKTRTLYLVWPDKNFWPNEEQSFSPVQRVDISVLSSAEVLAMMSKMYSEKLIELKSIAISKVSEPFNSSSRQLLNRS